MKFLGLHHIFDFFTGLDLTMGVLWIGLVAFTLGAIVLRYTRWGQSHQLEKCMALSVLAHILLLGYAATMHFVSPPQGGESVCYIALEDDTDSEKGEPGAIRSADDKKEDENGQSWRLHDTLMPQPKLIEPKAVPAELVEESKRLLDKLQTKLLGDSSLGQTAPNKIIAPEPAPVDVNARIGNLVPINSDDFIENTSAPKLLNPERGEHIASRINSPSNVGAYLDGKIIPGGQTAPLPDMYKLRIMPNRSGVAQQHGATPESEKAVQLALNWLANCQTEEGRWDPNEHDAGKELNVQGRNRQHAGNMADTGITGLALLAFLAGGHTHQKGPYAENMRQGLEYLLNMQAADGNLGGKGQAYEFMYCHAMASCALSEAYGMSRDPRLEKPVRRAIGYTVNSQDPSGGGWRYRPGDPGDTSQLGWQLMALKSAELAGIPMPASTRSGIMRFLQSVSSGQKGGLASYRPGERATRAMTAEAMVCWQFLGISRQHPACNEAGDFLLTELPGSGVVANDYYWYYATIAMYQLQGDYWRRWNDALQTTLINRQVKEGPLKGSWNTDTLWGSYGGRVYTTAIAALALEVYYRFLPLYAETAQTSDKQRR
jgi:hypothetical protein